MSWPETACGHVGLQQLREVSQGEAPEGPQREWEKSFTANPKMYMGSQMSQAETETSG